VYRHARAAVACELKKSSGCRTRPKSGVGATQCVWMLREVLHPRRALRAMRSAGGKCGRAPQRRSGAVGRSGSTEGQRLRMAGPYRTDAPPDRLVRAELRQSILRVGRHPELPGVTDDRNDQPPSTSRVWPVIQAAASDKSQATRGAMSLGAPQRRIGICAATDCRCSSEAYPVSTGPGLMQLTVTPAAPASPRPCA
jgi:hypothetical protein